MNQFYETPSKPGNVGGYQFAPTIAAFCTFILGNWAATQFLAHRLGYDGYAIHKPWMWVLWSIRNLLTTDPAIKSTLLIASAIACAGMFGGIFVSMAVRNWQIRKLEKGAEDLHGSAKWADKTDVRQTGLLDADHGVYVGGWQDGGRLHYLKHDGPEHVLAFAPTRSGKGVGLVIPTLLAWQESAVIYDIKGENYHYTSGWRAEIGEVIKFSPGELVSARFNPLASIRLRTPFDVKDAQNIAEMLAKPYGEVNHEHGYFFETAASLLSAAILYCCYAADEEARIACLADVHSFLDELKMLDEMQLLEHPVVRQVAMQMARKEDRNWDGVISTALTALKLWHDPLVAAHTSASDFTVQDLVNHERPVSLYIIVPASDMDRLRPLVRLMFTIIVNRLTEVMEFEGTGMKRNRHRLLLMVDEFPTLKSMPIFSNGLSYMAGYGITAYLICQDVIQIQDAYGQYQSIVSNCGIQVAYAPNTQETAVLLSETVGKTTIQRAHQSFSGSRYSPIANQISASVEHIERPLLAPDEFRRLRAPERDKSGRITKPGAMVIFVSGKKPIRGTQMLYFLDPELRRRSQIEPPAEMICIWEGEVYAQPPLELTPHVISRIEEPEESDIEEVPNRIDPY